ncbi:MAG TPA: hypothetical protein VMV18_02180, partial [bacterium]|nr:hypothetical protein [bacterium]
MPLTRRSRAIAGALGAASALLVPARAAAQAQELPGVLQTTLPPPSTRGYYGAGWVRVPLSLDMIVTEGKGWDYTAGAGSIGVHVGATSKWYFDAMGGGGFGGGHVFFNGKKEGGNFSGNHLQATLGRKVYLSETSMAVAFAGANWGRQVFTW